MKTIRAKGMAKRLTGGLLAAALALTALTGGVLAASWPWRDDDCPSALYDDVPDEDYWAHEGINFALFKCLMVGTGEYTFSPDETTTREMMVTILYQAAGSPAVEEASTFADVAEGQYYSDAVAWAEDVGVTVGVGGGQFGTGQAMTREQLIAMLYRYVELCGASEEGEETDLDEFPDADQVSGWAREAMAWGVSVGTIQGNVKDGTVILDPSGAATRAQVAVMLLRLEDKLGLPTDYEVLIFTYNSDVDETGSSYELISLLDGDVHQIRKTWDADDSYQILTDYNAYTDLLDRAEQLAGKTLDADPLDENYFQENAILAVELQRVSVPLLYADLAGYTIQDSTISLTIRANSYGHTANNSTALLLIQIPQTVTSAEVSTEPFTYTIRVQFENET